MGLTCKLLRRYLKVSFGTESEFVIQYLRRLPQFGDLNDEVNIRRLLYEIGTERFFVRSRHSWGFEFDVDKAIRTLASPTYAGVLHSIFGQLAEHNGMVRWGDSTAYNSDLPQVRQLFPDAQFIHVVRDGRDVSPSIRSESSGARNACETADDWNRTLESIHAFSREPYLTTLASVFEWRLPFDAVGPTLPGTFALLLIAAAISFATLVITKAALILALPFSTVLFFLSSTADAVREAERSKTVTATSAAEVQQAALAIVRRSRQVFRPRLVVLRVASNVRQRAVRQLASVCSLTLIDISEPTENVLWEFEELLTRYHGKYVLIGHHARAVALAQSDPGLTPVERRLAALWRVKRCWPTPPIGEV